MAVLAITGGFGTGKTTVAQMFKELGAAIVDVDALVRELEEPQKPVWKRIVQTFGKKVLKPDQSLNRKGLAQIVFSEPSELEKLNKAVHPLIMKETKKRVAGLLKKNKKRLIAVDIPLLFEVGEEKYFDFVAVVVADEKNVLERIRQNRHLSEQEIRQRMRSQIPLEEKVSRAHFVIDNNNGLPKTREQVQRIFQFVAPAS